MAAAGGAAAAAADRAVEPSMMATQELVV
eukprot:SAG11_NODE_36462_length_261_cov_0.956790_1_plen_28_part_01